MKNYLILTNYDSKNSLLKEIIVRNLINIAANRYNFNFPFINYLSLVVSKHVIGRGFCSC
jgi:hypothetical protein